MTPHTTSFEAEIAATLGHVQTVLSRKPGDPLPERQPLPERFGTLAKVFALTPAEADLLQCLIATHLAPHLHKRCEAWSGFAFVTEHLIRDAFGHGLQPIYASDSALNIWRLVQVRDVGPGLPMAFELDFAVLEWLAGKAGLAPHLHRRLARPAAVTQDPDMITRFAQPLAERMRKGGPLICLLSPQDGADVMDFLAMVAQECSVTLWSVTAGPTAFDDDDLLKLHRFARVQNAALAWDTPNATYLTPTLVPAAHLQFAPRENLATATLPAQQCLSLQIPAPGRAAVTALLQTRFPHEPATQLHRAAGIKGLTPRRIIDPFHDTLGALCAAQNAANSDALLEWAVPLQTKMRFDDLVLENTLKAQLRQLVGEIDAHAALWQDPEVARVYAQERALTILLKGPPGTGKTLSARILAGEAGLPLYRVDAASLTSKYVGETAENMRALFQAANQSGAMLFIDEFEAIVGKRTETRNEIARSYNHDTAYFLQLIETQFQGVAVFATNRPAEIDEAMHRRIRKVYDFGLPEKTERAALWRLALQPFAPTAEIVDFSAMLADDFAFSGSRIKSIVLNAHALGHADVGGITIANLRSAALNEARNNGRLPAKRELMRLHAFGADHTEGPLQ